MGCTTMMAVTSHPLPHLTVLVVHVARELEVVREALRASALPDRHDAVLLWVEHLAHLAHGLGVSGGGGEVTLEVQAAEQSAPAVVAVGCVGQAPGHEGLALQVLWWRSRCWGAQGVRDA